MYSMADLTKLQGRGLLERILDGKKSIKLKNLVRTIFIENGETSMGQVEYYCPPLCEAS